MNADPGLDVATALLSFIFRTTFCFIALRVIVRLVHSPSRRFILWMMFLVGIWVYWSTLLVSILWRSSRATGVGSGTPHISNLPAQSSLALSWVLPESMASYAGSALHLLTYFYIAAIGVALLMQIRRHLRLRQILTFAYMPDVKLSCFCDAIAGRLSIGNQRLLVLPGLASPATFGWLRPTVLLPATCEQQDLGELADVLRHELHHIKRRDYLVERTANCIRAMLFFHPAAWLVCCRLALEREMACDQAVLRNHPEHRADYAERLIRFARLASAGDKQVFGMDFAAKSGHLHTRIDRVLASPRAASWWQRSLRASVSVSLLAAVSVLVPSITISLAYSYSDLRAPLRPAERIETTNMHGRIKRAVTSIRANSQHPTALPVRQNAPESISVPVSKAQGATKTSYVLTPPADTVDEHRGISASSDQNDTGFPSGNPSRTRTGKSGPATQSVTAAITTAVTRMGQLRQRDHDRDFR